MKKHLKNTLFNEKAFFVIFLLLTVATATGQSVAGYSFTNGSLSDDVGSLNAIALGTPSSTTDRKGDADNALQISSGNYAWVNDPILDIRNNFTINLWLKLDAEVALGEAQYILDGRQNPDGDNLGGGLGIQVNQDEQINLVFWSSTSSSLFETGRANLEIGEWTMFTVVKESNAFGNFFDIYINGTKVISQSVGVANSIVQGSSWVIGAQGDIRFFNGAIDDITFYDELLSDEEVNDLLDINVAPTKLTINSKNISEGQPIGTVVGTLETFDPNPTDTHIYSLGGTDASSFTISGSDLTSGEVFDYATKNIYNIDITTDDQLGGTFTGSFEIKVIPDSLPVHIEAAYDFSNGNLNDLFGTKDATAVGTPSLKTDRKGNTGQALGISNNNYARINDQVIDITKDFAINLWYKLEAPSNDSQVILDSRLSPSQAEQGGITITFDPNEELVIVFYGSGAREELKIGPLSTPLDEWTMLTLSRSNNEVFLLLNGTEVFRGNASSAFRNAPSWTIGAQGASNREFNGAIDDLIFFNESLTQEDVQVLLDVNVAPVDITLSSNVIENLSPSGSTVGSFTVKDANASDTHSLSLGGSDAVSFELVGNDLVTTQEFDASVKASYEITVTADDGNGGTFSKDFTIFILEDNAAENAVAAFSFTQEGLQDETGNFVLTALGTPQFSEDRAGNANHSLLVSTGNNAWINDPVIDITGDITINVWLKLNSEVNSGDAQYIIDGRYDPNQANPGGGLGVQVNGNEEINTVFWNSGGGSIFQTTSVPIEVGEWVMFTLVKQTTGLSNNLTTYINGVEAVNQTLTGSVLKSQRWIFGSSGNIRYLNGSIDDVLFYEEALSQGAIAKLFSNTVPSAIDLSSIEIDEGVPVGTVVGTLSTTDINASDSHHYELFGTDAASFTINGNNLESAEVFDFETRNSYEITVHASDNNGGYYGQEFSISILDTEGAPTDIELSNLSIGSGLPVGTPVGSLSTLDAEPAENYAYTISGTDAASFSIDGDRLVSAVVFDTNDQSTYNITITSTDPNDASFSKDFTIDVVEIDFEEGLRGFYTFNEGRLINTYSGQSASPDAFAVGNPMATTNRRGEEDRALQISDNNFARIPSDVFGNTFFLVNAWFKLDQDITSDIQVILDSRQNALGQETGGFTISVDAEEKINVGFWRTSPSFQNTLNLNASEPITVGDWNMISLARTSENEGSRIIVYLNGEEIMKGDLQQVGEEPFYDPGELFTIGAQSTSNREWNGAIDDISFYTEWDQTKIFGLFTRPETNAFPSDILLSTSQIIENEAIGTVIGTLSSVDLDDTDTHTYTLGGNDAASFTINGNNLESAEVFDFETLNSYSITITTDDGKGATFEKSFTIAVENEPELLAKYKFENTLLDSLGTNNANAVGTPIFINDRNGNPESAIKTSVDNYARTTSPIIDITGDFTINLWVRPDNVSISSGQWLLSSRLSDVDEPRGGFGLVINANKGLNLGAWQESGGGEFQVLNEQNLISLNVEQWQMITITKTSNEIKIYKQGSEANSISLTGNELFDNGERWNFGAVGSGREEFVGGLDDVAFYDGALEDSEVMALYDISNDAPTDISLSSESINENAPIGSVIGTLSTSDADAGDAHTYTISGTDASSFTVNGNELLSAEVFDFETKSSYAMAITTTDLAGATFTKAFTITVNDVNEETNNAPTDIALSNTTIDENEPQGTNIGILSTTDADEGDSHTYALSGSDATSFSVAIEFIEGLGNVNVLRSGEVFDFETKSSYAISITTTDLAGATFTKAFTITVNNVNEAPTEINLSTSTVEENQPAGTFIGYFTTLDPDANENHTIELGGDDATSFSVAIEFIEGPGNVNVLRSEEVFDFETKDTYTLSVTSFDAGGLSITSTFTITVLDADENNAPTDIALSTTTIDENEPQGTIVGILSTTDADEGDSHTYALSGSDAASFTVSGNELSSAEIFDFEIKASYSIEVTSTDAAGATFQKTFTITVNDIDENNAPTDIALSTTTIDENEPQGTIVGILSTTDADEGDSHTYALSGSDAASFTVSGNELSSAEIFDFETKASYSIEVTSTDVAGATFQKTFTITVNDIDESEDVLSVGNPEEAISIYPNPSGDFLFINTQASGPIAFRIVNAQGQVVKTGNNRKVDIQSLAAGTYLVEITGKNKNVVRFIKK